MEHSEGESVKIYILDLDAGNCLNIMDIIVILNRSYMCFKPMTAIFKM
jgi:hypothetical protein